MQTILSLDIGTTGAKAALVDRGGSLLATGYAEYPTYTSTHTGSGGVVEQEPDDWWNAVRLAVNDLWREGAHAGPQSVAGVALSGQMQDLILLGETGALGRAILYSDTRAQEEATWLAETVDADELARITGNEQGAGSLLAKWRWLQIHDAARLAQARKILGGAHGYIAWQLTVGDDGGASVADPTTASTTGLLDLARNEWATPLLNQLGFDVNKLPDLLAAGEICGHVSDSVAQQLLLLAGTPVYTGAGDLGATTVGVGAGEPGRLYGYLGTSGWIAATVDEATPAPERGVFTLRHPDGARFVQVAPMLTAGGNLEWARAEIGAEEAEWAWLNQQAASVPPGSDGLLYLPWLNGERSPFNDPNARAALIGLSTSTTRAAMLRAVMEGVALALRSLHDALDPAPSDALYLVGGGAKSTVWPQIVADVLACEVRVLAEPGSAAARGAAIIAGRALGWYENYAPDGFFPVAATFTPVAQHVPVYDALYAVYETLHSPLRDAFAALAAVRSGEKGELS